MLLDVFSATHPGMSCLFSVCETTKRRLFLPKNRVSTSVYRNAEMNTKRILDGILERENCVLETWTQRKRKLDQCQQYVLVEHSARQALKWIREVGDDWLQTRSSGATVNMTKEEAADAYKSLNDFRLQVKETKEKVRLLLQLSENLMEKGHSHSSAIKHWCTMVESSFRDYVQKLDAYRYLLEEKLGIRSPVADSVAGDRSSDSSLDSKLSRKDSVSSSGSVTPSTGVPLLPSPGQPKMGIVTPSSSSVPMSTQQNLQPPLSEHQLEARRKSTRKKEFIMAELLQTERTYIRDLDVCIRTYLHEFRRQRSVAPKIIFEREKVLFGNIEDIYEFHNRYVEPMV